MEGMQQGILQGIEKGMLQGMQRGRDEGIQYGMQQGEASILKRQLRFRFGTIPQAYEDFINQADLETLETLSQDLFTAQTMQDLFRKWF